MQDIYQYIDKKGDHYLEQLFALLHQPSVSAQGLGLDNCAQLVMKLLKEAGAETQIFQTSRYPIVFGQIRSSSADRTLLIYGHYDVQPPEPLDLWDSPPFNPTLRDGRIYARGASDNKGQLLASIKAAEAILRIRGKTSTNLTFLLEGEEEIMSPNLQPFVLDNKDLLKADACLICDGTKHQSGLPTIICGLKGMLSIELRARGANCDLHSMQAAMVKSPVWKLVRALASLRTQDDQVSIPGFYDTVRKPTEADLAAIGKIPIQAENLRYELGIDEFLGGDDAYYQNLFFSPTCNIAGIKAGYTGIGFKTVLPSEAVAKMDFRLVPEQRPSEILELLKNFFKAQSFEDIEIIKHGEILPSRTPTNHSFVQLVAAAINHVTNEEPIIIPSAGFSGPDYLFTDVLHLPSVWLPLGPHDSNNHSPNENIVVEDFFEGIKIISTIIESMGRTS